MTTMAAKSRRTRIVRMVSLGLLVSLSAGATVHQLRSVIESPDMAAQAKAGPDFETPIGGPFRLADIKGDIVTAADYSGRWMLVFFGCTHCSETSPLALREMADGIAKLGPLASQVAPLFITVDPARDTPDRLVRYLRDFDPRITGLTGSETQIADAAKSYRVYFSPLEHERSGIDIASHANFLYLIAPNGKFDGLLPVDGDAQSLAESLRTRIQMKSGT